MPDNGYVIIGTSTSNYINIDGFAVESINTDVLNYPIGMIIKKNSNSETEWVKYIDNGQTILLNDIKNTQDGGFVVAGRFCGPDLTVEGKTVEGSGSIFNKKGLLLKYNVNGELDWIRTIDENGADGEFNSFIETEERKSYFGWKI